jgi:hypothetical protein
MMLAFELGSTKWTLGFTTAPDQPDAEAQRQGRGTDWLVGSSHRCYGALSSGHEAGANGPQRS